MNDARTYAPFRRALPRIALLSVCTLALAACAQDQTRPDLAGRGKCDAAPLSWAIGKPLDEASGRKLFKQSGAGLWRVISPDNTFTEDFREDRLNVRVDAANTVTAIDCG